MTVRDAAAALGMSTRRLRRLCHDGRVHGARRRETERGPVWSVPVGPDGLPVISPGARGPELRSARR